ncbi:hypothetical protein KUCAC02_035474, partial [Chaenocephalus aceratus]
ISACFAASSLVLFDLDDCVYTLTSHTVANIQVLLRCPFPKLQVLSVKPDPSSLSLTNIPD